MAASMTVGVAAGVVPVRNASGLSAPSSFGSPLLNHAVAPLRPVRRNVVVTRAALPEEQSGKTARREMLASLTAAGAALATAGAALATAGSSFAASGPGTPGAQRTNEKAGELLKKADDLATTESPPRYGTGEADGTSKIAQKGGAGAIESLQGAGGE
ncbi:unnamed protein product [Calypogeia fissa]